MIKTLIHCNDKSSNKQVTNIEMANSCLSICIGQNNYNHISASLFKAQIKIFSMKPVSVPPLNFQVTKT